MKNKPKSTYEKFIEDEEQKSILDQEYRDLLISELIRAAMEEDHLSVRKLAASAGVSPTIVQGLKSGTKTNINLDTLLRVLDAMDYCVVFEPKNGRGRQLRLAWMSIATARLQYSKKTHFHGLLLKEHLEKNCARNGDSPF